ncbi:apolipoprotein acyltransferase [Salipiger aestuarii]|uniref:Apolipoprotein acyltransferase n=1 Tax=Salipiger aestuarii TaxID=568098 RepID=A0A327Y7Y0_9RHOB|nr:hypothetical protein [Salipiger aestuarii]EIE50940.1 hypothetical protein C357_11444 [Citreicella sp. 357]KAA8607385.1 apolipoprotein acyltransferase [Salipiger aestuarii]KAA8612130.1 apolipoprotein acyltransferase [Salipiger aestuarii]KAB2541763.1 apolipoprotein acyltransferase [Salipiger aestuarii]RAK17238.1 hypothetical protein ATI53_101536 [Salipiger aestuarii]
MIMIAATLAGALLGGLTARRRKGNAADVAQYATGFAIAFLLAGLIVTIIVEKTLS